MATGWRLCTSSAADHNVGPARSPPPHPRIRNPMLYPAQKHESSSFLNGRFSIGVERVLMRPAHLRQPCAPAQRLFQERIVIEHVYRPGIGVQAIVETRHHALQT